jgi:hypothetical protein
VRIAPDRGNHHRCPVQFPKPSLLGLVRAGSAPRNASRTILARIADHPINDVPEYPELELSTNLGENSMRPIAIGRRNWLHLRSKEAGPRIAAIFSVIESCRRLNIPIRKYLGDVLPGLANRSIQSLTEVTPTAYAAKLAN